MHTAMIGAFCTFAHDFFITPSDSKYLPLIDTYYSDKAKTITLLSPLGEAMCEDHNQGRRSTRSIPLLPSNGQHEHPFCYNGGLRK